MRTELNSHTFTTKSKGKLMNPIKDHLDQINTDQSQNEMDRLESDYEVLSDAEHAAFDADAPKKRYGTVRLKLLTAAQTKFMEGIVSGLSQRQAYREAYPNDSSNDACISANAAKLMKHPVVKQRLEDAWSETMENLADDANATKRFVLRSLLVLCKAGQTESTKLKALDLMGRSIGLWKDSQTIIAPAPSAAQLKKDLAGHLKLFKQKA